MASWWHCAGTASTSTAVLRLGDSYVVRNGEGRLKGAKTEVERQLSLDSVTVQVLIDFRSAQEEALSPARLTLPDDAFVFSPAAIGARPWHPDHFTHAYRNLATGLGIPEPLKNLRHFNATQLLAAGVDLPTTAGRLATAMVERRRCVCTPVELALLISGRPSCSPVIWTPSGVRRRKGRPQ